MARKIGRREFFRTSAGAGLTLALSRALVAPAGAEGKAPVVGVGIGTDGESAALKAVQLLGGMKKFVPKGAASRYKPWLSRIRLPGCHLQSRFAWRLPSTH